MKSASQLHLACGLVRLSEYLAFAAQARRSGRLSYAKVASNISLFNEKCSLCFGAWTDINLRAGPPGQGALCSICCLSMACPQPCAQRFSNTLDISSTLHLTSNACSSSTRIHCVSGWCAGSLQGGRGREAAGASGEDAKAEPPRALHNVARHCSDPDDSCCCFQKAPFRLAQPASYPHSHLTLFSLTKRQGQHQTNPGPSNAHLQMLTKPVQDRDRTHTRGRSYPIRTNPIKDVPLHKTAVLEMLQYYCGTRVFRR